MAISSTSRNFLLLLAVAVLLAFLTTSPATADENNLLLTGDTLATDGQLSYGTDTTFVMQDDCNLVLYNKGSGFQSNTHGYGTNCSLTLSNLGQLIIQSSDGSTVWSSPSTSTKTGSYAAVLRPDGQLAVYGPSVWSAAAPPSTTIESGKSAELDVIPMVRNVLFSDQTLYNGAELATRDYTFVMRADCNLALVKASVGDVWTSGTKGKGQHCFARLNHRGQLAVEDDRYKTLWGSKPVAAKDGDYVLVLQIHGQAVIYGPVVWSTASN